MAQPDEILIIDRPEVVHVDTEAEIAVVVDSDVVHVDAGVPGPPGRDGLGGGGGAGVFVLDVQPLGGGIVAGKTWADTVPAQRVLTAATSDGATVRVVVGCDGGADSYSPEITVAGVPAALTETATRRWFEGYADVPLAIGANTISAVSSDGAEATVTVERVGAGPDILSIDFGAYPGAQTALKAGDQIGVAITTAPDAASVTVQAVGAAASAVSLPVVGGLAQGFITISGASGAQTITAVARNGFGTDGAAFTSSGTLALDQTYPSIGAITVGYDNGLAALGAGETGTVSCAITGADAVAYSSPDVLIEAPAIYAPTKAITNNRTGYVGSGTNLTITATRAANGAISTASALVRIATVAPTAAISIAGVSGRLASSPTGIDYEIRVTPDQLVTAAPSLTAGAGAWQGSWVNAGSYWRRSLRISDATARGSAIFSGLSIIGPSGIEGTAINSGASYTVGGFSLRTITFPAFSRVAALGVSVADQTKTSAQLAGGSVLTRYTDNAEHSAGYYIANSDGSYNPTGDYIGLSDPAFAGSNTTGTLQVIAQEVA